MERVGSVRALLLFSVIAIALAVVTEQVRREGMREISSCGAVFLKGGAFSFTARERLVNAKLHGLLNWKINT